MTELNATSIPWGDGHWTNEPVAAEASEDGLRVTAVEGSDAWRTTSYGFIHDTEHALLRPFEQDSAIEVEFAVDFTEQFDQAGIFLRVDDETWIKAGIELSDGQEQLGAVVTRSESDWSLAPVPEWGGRRVTVRASRDGNAVTIRARVDAEPWRLVRVAPMAADALVAAGPFCCAPSRGGLVVHFTSWRTTPADASLHP
ncbi:DUF1349 domain-containing protein [Pseudoclavibacter sp. VKM Ac-2867]|uniref:DUF1349 domain-containing protein n=1 Tax=Pseudoclavibacter sp. VKM Ac-2867 TaxID=2783829 RepID=UPI00188B0245|nr:DUF1349 domain-containing protein [Pseudoclavibacter sp. VKM Ac-2867]MBF4457810.1 DUF1349 domain-containing protein [Pseudoclavibacter sp. VKM Ac-2867]